MRLRQGQGQGQARGRGKTRNRTPASWPCRRPQSVRSIPSQLALKPTPAVTKNPVRLLGWCQPMVLMRSGVGLQDAWGDPITGPSVPLHVQVPLPQVTSPIPSITLCPSFRLRHHFSGNRYLGTYCTPGPELTVKLDERTVDAWLGSATWELSTY